MNEHLYTPPCFEVEQEIQAWMRRNERSLPKSVLSNEHLTEVWLTYIEEHENDASGISR